MNGYVIQDRTLATKWEISVAGGQLTYTSTESAASDDPILEDYSIPGTYWKILIDNGEMGFESTLTEQNDSLIFTDTETGAFFQLAISDGQMNLIQQVTAAIVRLTNNIIVRYSVVGRIVKYNDSQKVCI